MPTPKTETKSKQKPKKDATTQAASAEARAEGPATHAFQAEVSQVLSLVINSLYSNKDIYLRELISNAADALDKLRFLAIERPELLGSGYRARIRLVPDAEASTLTIDDNGIGMTREQLVSDLGTVARSGTRELAQRLKERADAPSLIGQFGVGFYSGYLVADRIEVVSRAAGEASAHRWSSTGKDTFSVEPAERDEAGTSVTLHLSPEHKEHLNEWKLRELVRQYSDFIGYPIELRVPAKEEAGEPSFQAINQGSALWTRPKKEISDAQYDDLYRHISHDFEAPLARTHFQVEGTQLFTGLLFVPKHAGLDLFNPDARHGVRLYVRRVFIMEDCEELLPRFLRFVRGVIDTDDLPLNVSRELLQDSAVVRTIRKQVIRRVLDALLELAEQRPDDYLTFYRAFGAVLKEGLHFEPAHKDKLGKLVRYESTRGEGLVSLDAYVERMPAAQSAIYYAIGPTRALLDKSPQLEALKQRGFEVLLMTDGVDQWALEGLSSFAEKPLVNAMEADVDLGAAPDAQDKEQAAQTDKQAVELGPLLARCKEILSEHIESVRVSSRLTDSPACLVIPKGGLPAHIERLIRAQRGDMPAQKRIFELNPTHRLVRCISAELAKDPSSTQVTESIEMLYDQALLSEGSPLPDPARFAARVARLMQAAMPDQSQSS